MPSRLTYLALIASLLGSTFSAPAPVPQSGSEGHAYQCPSSQNIPARKASLQSMGATDLGTEVTTRAKMKWDSSAHFTRHES